MTNFVTIVRSIKNLLTSPLRIGALELSPTALKYLSIRGNSVIQASLRLPPGIIEKGVVKNRPLLIAALHNLHSQITPKIKPINVIVTIPSNLVFSQSFSVPIVASQNLGEAITLNLQMTSPNKIEDSYYDYQEIKLNKDIGHIDLLGAFTARQPINAYEEALHETNFVPVAIEFPGLSLARLIRDRWGGIESSLSYLLMHISGEGLLMLILKNGNLAFNHFTSWQEIGSAEPTSFVQAKDLIKREIQRVVNFHIGRTGQTIEEVILISPIFNYEIVDMASKELKMKVRNLTIPELPKLPPNWFPVLGAALRGLVARSKDTDISLAAEGSQAEYYHERTLNFIGLWRNILIGSLVVIMSAFVLIDTIIARTENQLQYRVSEAADSESAASSLEVQKKIIAFNKLVDAIESIGKTEIIWSGILKNTSKIASKSVILERVFLDKVGLQGVIAGRSIDDKTVLAFKDAILNDSRIASVKLPLSNIKSNPDKSVQFSMSIVLKPLPTKDSPTTEAE